MENESPYPRCQVDASWVTNSPFSGGGFVLELAPGTVTYGSIGMDQTMSPMHAEFTIFLYAMKNSLQLGVTSMSFESDCLQLNEFTHLLSLFTVFSISFIARERNVRADFLAKGARSKNSIFSHVDSVIPGWLVHKANIFILN
ncbi:hypothetical protein Bca52824_052342 [Brassica carinata]|uniref:RNase H type-1 domain-containing protein n=1 Tax=Brassica carinata TaxID=52824 RepID=A0A8X7R3T2_BRACI|nr:hypothetical protein Bca52824_052342 [Brassica carinata]